MLGYDSLGDKLLTFQLYDQQANVPLGIIPLLQVDMWEHAFYLQYKNVKADYVKAFWNVVNWADVQNRYAAADVEDQGPDLRLIPLAGSTGRRASARRPVRRFSTRVLLCASARRSPMLLRTDPLSCRTGMYSRCRGGEMDNRSGRPVEIAPFHSVVP